MASAGVTANDRLDDIVRKGEVYFREQGIADGEEWKSFQFWVARARAYVDSEGRFAPNSVVQQSFAQYKYYRDISAGVQGQKGKEQVLSAKESANAPSDWTNIVLTTKQSNIGAGSHQYNTGAGRVNCVRFHSTNANIIYAGTAGGGVWKTTNGGGVWTPLTDNDYKLPILEIKDIALHPNGTTLYVLASGSVNISGGDGGISNLQDCFYKSTNGGQTWMVYSIDTSASVNSVYLRRLVVDKLHPDTLYAVGNSGSRAGIYRSMDGGTTWASYQTNVQSYDMETVVVHDTTLFYMLWKDASGNVVFRRLHQPLSGAASVHDLTLYSGSSSATIGQMYMAAAPNGVVYLVFLNTNGAYTHVKKSTDYGWSFTNVNTTVFPLGNQGVLKPRGGSFEVCPTSTNTLYLGGAVLCRSTNGAQTWETISSTQTVLATLYVDHNDIEFHPTSTTPIAFDGNDGGVYSIQETVSSSGTQYALTFLPTGMEALQCYRLGVGRSNSQILLAGTHDNGSYKFDVAADVQTKIGGGDGMECMVHHDSSNIIYWSSQNGNLSRSSAGGTPTDNVQDVQGSWTTPFIMDYANPETLYVATTASLRSVNGGQTWVTTSTTHFSSAKIKYFVQAPLNQNVFYAATDSELFYSTDAGVTWDTASKPGSTGNFTRLAVDPVDANVVYAAFGGYDNQRVFRSTDYGNTWSSRSLGLPALPAHCIVIDPRRPTEAYLGMEYGVWYNPDITSTTSSWQDYAGGLPNVAPLELEIHADSHTLYAATSGRGLWKTPMKHSADAAAGYCTPQGTAVDDYNTGIVKAELIDNATGDTLMSISSLPNQSYTRYDEPQPTLRQGQSYSLRLTFASDAWLQKVKVWADWNRDGVFQYTGAGLTGEDSTWNTYELIASTGTISQLNPVRTFTFTVPADSGYMARIGDSFLRVAVDWQFSSADMTPCGNVDYGEYEDYAIAIDYCQPKGSASYNIGTTNVTLKLLPLSQTVLNQSSTAQAAYTDYTNTLVSIIRGRNYRLYLTGATSYSQKVSVFIDWNKDGDFADANEVVLDEAALSTTGSINTTFTVPLIVGNAPRMRVVSDWSASSVTLTPCSNPIYGEVEDYELTPLLQSSVAGGSDGPDTVATTVPDGNNLHHNGQYGELKIYPNPLDGESVSIEFVDDTGGLCTIVLADVLGRELVSMAYTGSVGTNIVHLQLPEQLRGIYSIAVKKYGVAVHKGVFFAR